MIYDSFMYITYGSIVVFIRDDISMASTAKQITKTQFLVPWRVGWMPKLSLDVPLYNRKDTSTTVINYTRVRLRYSNTLCVKVLNKSRKETISTAIDFRSLTEVRDHVESQIRRIQRYYVSNIYNSRLSWNQIVLSDWPLALQVLGSNEVRLNVHQYNIEIKLANIVEKRFSITL